MEEDRVTGRWKVVEISGDWIQEGIEEEALSNPLLKKSSEERSFGEASSSDRREDGAREEQPKKEQKEDVSILFEAGMLELLLSCDEEGHAKWQLRNATDRKFVNPFSQVDGFSCDEEGIIFISEEHGEFASLGVTFDATGKMSIVREDGSFLVLQKIIEPKKTFSLEDMLEGERPFSNVSLKTGDHKSIQAHSVILAARCPLLLEKEGRELLAKQDGDLVEGLLFYLYSDRLKEDAPAYARELKKVAKKLGLERLRLVCEECIQNNAIKNEIFQHISELSQAVDRFKENVSSNFMRHQPLHGFFDLLVKEAVIFSFRLVLIFYLYGKSKKELTKTEKKELREFMRVKGIDLVERVTEALVIFYDKINLFQPAGRDFSSDSDDSGGEDETINELLLRARRNQLGAGLRRASMEVERPQGGPEDSQAARFREGCRITFDDHFAFLGTIMPDIKQLMEELSNDWSDTPSTAMKLLGGQKILRLLPKMLLKSLNRLINLNYQYFSLNEADRRAYFQRFFRIYLSEILRENGEPEYADLRRDYVEHVAKKAMNPTVWKITLKAFSVNAVKLFTEVQHRSEKIGPAAQRISQKFSDQGFLAIFQRLGLLPKTEQSTSEVESPQHSSLLPTGEHLTNQMKRFIKSEEQSDMHFIVEGKRIPAHRAIVASRCPHFARSLLSGMRETNEREIVIPEVSAACFGLLLEYFYGGVELELADVEVVIELLKVCDQYEVEPLSQMCAQLLQTHLDEENAVTLLSIAETYHVDGLKMNAIQFIAENPAIEDDEEFENLEADTKELIKSLTVRQKRATASTETISSRAPPQEPDADAELDDDEVLADILNEMRAIVGEEAEEEALIRWIRAADYDVNRAVNLFFEAS